MAAQRDLTNGKHPDPAYLGDPVTGADNLACRINLDLGSFHAS